jgi:hypothetical protein
MSDEPRPPQVSTVKCFHCDRTGQGWNGRVPEGWNPYGIGHQDCPECASRYPLPGANHPMTPDTK